MAVRRPSLPLSALLTLALVTRESHHVLFLTIFRGRSNLDGATSMTSEPSKSTSSEDNATGQESNPHTLANSTNFDHLWRIHDSIQQLTRAADSKAFALIVLASGLLFALVPIGFRGPFWLAVVSAIAVAALFVAIALAIMSVIPKTDKTAGSSHIFSGDIAEYTDAERFRQAVAALPLSKLTAALCSQIYVVAKIANRKLSLVGAALAILIVGALVSLVAIVSGHGMAQVAPVHKGVSVPTAHSRRPVTVAQFGDLLLYLPLYIAKYEGIFEDHGLDVTIISTGGDEKTFAAVLAGDAQFGVADPTFAAIASQQGQQGRVVASIVQGMPNYAVSLIPNDRIISSPSELDGVTIATPPAPSTAYLLIKHLYEAGGLTPSIRQVAPSGLLATVKAGDADYALLIEPWVSQVVREGGTLALSLQDYYDEFALTGVTVSADLVHEDPDLIRRFNEALSDAVTIFYADEATSLRVARRVFPTEDPRDLKAGLSRHRGDRIYPFDLQVSENAWNSAVELRRESGELSDDAGKFEDIVDNSLH